jgi:RNA polymerase sigma factor (sigma-70 family)
MRPARFSRLNYSCAVFTSTGIRLMELMHEDAELLRLYATDRSEAAFTELIRRQVDLVYSAALRLMNGDVHRAQDVTQQVFSELARQARRLTRHPALAGWLYTTTRLMALRATRTEQRRTAREQEANAMNELLREPGPEQDWKHLGPVLEDAMHELGEKDRLAVLLRFFQNKSLKEVGLALGLSENAARMRVERALDKLRAQLAQKGVTSTAAALALLLAGNAVSATPAGFVATLSSASFASAAAGTGTALTLLKFMATTKLKTGVISAIVVASVVTPLMVQHQAQARLRHQDEALLDRVDRLTRLQEENERLSILFAQANKSPARSNEPFSELLRLRGEVGRLRMDLRELEQAKTNAPLSRNEMLASMANYYSERVNQLKQLLETNPSEKIPELQFLSDRDWVWLVNKKTILDTEDGYRGALSKTRLVAEQHFINEHLNPALQEYAQDNNGQFPSSVSQLKPYFKSPIDDAVLQRWAVLPRNKLVKELQEQLEEDWYVTQKAPVNRALDQRILRGLKRVHSLGYAPPDFWDVVP